MDWGAWRATVRGVTKSLTRWSTHPWVYPHPPASPNTLKTCHSFSSIAASPLHSITPRWSLFMVLFFNEVKFTNLEVLHIFALHFWQLDTPGEPTFPSSYRTLLPSPTVLLISLSPRQPLIWLISALINSASSRAFYKWNHIVDMLLRLSSFVQYWICEIHPSGCLYW